MSSQGKKLMIPVKITYGVKIGQLYIITYLHTTPIITSCFIYSKNLNKKKKEEKFNLLLPPLNPKPQLFSLRNFWRRKMKQQQQWRLSATLVFLVLVLQTRAAEDGFITTNGVHFMLKGSPFYGNGFNAYWLMYVASDPSQRYKISIAFQQARNHGLSVARTWAFSDGGYSPLQFSPGSYNEQMFKVCPIFLSFSFFFWVTRKTCDRYRRYIYL